MWTLEKRWFFSLFGKPKNSEIRKAVQSFDIINDPEFSNANKVFAAKCVQMKNDGLGKVQHKSPMDDADTTKVYESAVFDTSQPQTLLNNVFCEICFVCADVDEKISAT